MKKYSLILVSLLLSIAVSAQNFKWKLAVDSVKQSGFHQLKLPTFVKSKLAKNYADIRLYNADNQEVPYILNTELPTQTQELFHEYKIIEKTHNKKHAYTRILIHNPDSSEISSISLIIKNAEVRKWLKLNAGDDKKNWYVLKDRYIFHSINGLAGTSLIKVLNFPLSNYKYYELLISDYFDRPINVLKAGYFDQSIEMGKYSEIGDFTLSQNDSLEEKNTLFEVQFTENQVVDKVHFTFNEAGFFLRQAEILLRDSTQYRKRPTQYFYRSIKQFQLSSFDENTVLFDGFSGKKILIRIKNDDDKPLKISNLNIYQLNTYLTAELEQGQKYSLRFGADLAAPRYDLRFFQDSINKNLPTARLGKLQKIQHEKAKQAKPLIDPQVLWLILALVIVLLAFMSFKMIKDMKKREQKN